MKSGRGLILISVAAGVSTWFLNALFERLYGFGPGKTYVDLLINIPPEEIYDRGITLLVFVLLGVIISWLYEKRVAAEARLATLVSELRRSNAELEQFAAVASHDLKGPLVTIGGFLTFIQRRHGGNLDADVNRHIRHALENVKRMEGLIGDLLEFSRVSAWDRRLEAIDSSAVLDAILENLAVILQTRGVVLTRDPLPVVMADPARLGQIFQNLVDNAIKFCRDETPRIHVSAVRRGKECLFSVRDNGIGIGPEHLGEIFTAFRRLHKWDEYPGTGLGLATCLRIAEQHGGRIWAESRPGEGSTFFFTIPAGERESGHPGIREP